MPVVESRRASRRRFRADGQECASYVDKRYRTVPKPPYSLMTM
jgi:hypothetical protein